MNEWFAFGGNDVCFPIKNYGVRARGFKETGPYYFLPRRQD